ncbi:hypothetical protein SAMN05216464_1308 [Mucilaginibacter pineti]|uniref:Uncharacterized protein n=1 Tax=Mucilaginibacter pineti TaxID=1391627 RepID=A0A1G7NX01_9SPHI|nr:hypothetical protein SAMN05216464_1308 [Mucilaginibacter pineti]
MTYNMYILANKIQMVRYTITLTKEEVGELYSIVNKGSHTSQTFRTAYILLNCDEGEYAEKIIMNRSVKF